MDEEDIKKLKNQYHLSRIIDLRCSSEASIKPDVTWPEVEYILNPVLPNEKIGISKKGNMHEDFTDFIQTLKKNGIRNSIAFMEDIYKDVVTSEFSLKAYQKFIQILLKPVSGTTLWHCSAGKDRAGFATILVLYLLDFKMEDIIEDYLSTNLFYEENVASLMKIYGSDYEEILWSVFGVRKEYVDIMMSSIKEKFGGMEGYLEAMGITSQDRSTLKRIYLGE